MKVAVFKVVVPCRLAEVYQRFRGACCLHHQGDEHLPNIGKLRSLLHGVTTQKIGHLQNEGV
jgi:hypothetical protein